MSQSSSPPWYQDLKVYREPRLWTIFGFGVISGFPWVLIGSMLSAWLQEMGVNRSAIGLFGVVFVVYSINALWAPFVDRIRIPGLHRHLGARRAWIAFCLFGILAATLLLSQISVVENLWWAAFAALLIAIFSATQDIAIDAFRIETFGPHEARLQSAGAAMATAGWWTGYSGLGAIPFLFVDGTQVTWQDAYGYLCLLIGIQIITVFWVRESQRYQQAPPVFNHWLEWLAVTLVAPITEFFKRSGWQLAIGILSFIFLFKLGEAFLGRMSIVFYKEVGFTNEEIGIYSKMVNWWVTIIFAILGSYVNLRVGIIRGLLIGGVAMASSNLMFAWIAGVGPDTNLLLAAVLIDGFTGAWSTVAFVAFISLLCHRAFTATQYALFASLGNLGRTLLSSYSGYVVDWLEGDWQLFFILTAVMVVPSLIILIALRKPLTRLEQQYHQEQQ